MEPPTKFHSRTTGFCRATAQLAAIAVLVGAGLAATRSDARQNPAGQPQEESDEPNFVVIPLRTELQRKLVADGKRITAMIQLNGYALLGNREGLMRAIDALPLQKTLAAMKARDPNASVALVIGYFGSASPEMSRKSRMNRDAVERTCRLVANGAKVSIVYISSTYDSTPDRWEKTVAALQKIDFGKETADETAVGDADVRAFAVRTQVTRLLTTTFSAETSRGADCVVYLNKPIEANDNPLIDAQLEARLADTIKKLNLPEKNRIDYHLIPAHPSRAAAQRNREAIQKRFLGQESQALSERLGFKGSAVTF
jgi:hypothetical protein